CRQLAAVAQEGAAVGVLPLRIRRREVLADVAKGQRPEHCVAQRVYRHVALRFGQHAALVRHPHAADDHEGALAKGMDVLALPDPHFHYLLRETRNSASARSAGVVTLRLSSRPSTSRGRAPPSSIAMASSVTCTPMSFARSSARSSGPWRKACGVRARQSRSRGSVASMVASVAPRLSVS